MAYTTFDLSQFVSAFPPKAPIYKYIGFIATYVATHGRAAANPDKLEAWFGQYVRMFMQTWCRVTNTAPRFRSEPCSRENWDTEHTGLAERSRRFVSTLRASSVRVRRRSDSSCMRACVGALKCRNPFAVLLSGLRLMSAIQDWKGWLI